MNYSTFRLFFEAFLNAILFSTFFLKKNIQGYRHRKAPLVDLLSQNFHLKARILKFFQKINKLFLTNLHVELSSCSCTSINKKHQNKKIFHFPSNTAPYKVGTLPFKIARTYIKIIQFRNCTVFQKVHIVHTICTKCAILEVVNCVKLHTCII